MTTAGLRTLRIAYREFDEATAPMLEINPTLASFKPPNTTDAILWLRFQFIPAGFFWNALSGMEPRSPIREPMLSGAFISSAYERNDKVGAGSHTVKKSTTDPLTVSVIT